MNTASGIYRIRNLKNGKCYIGSAVNFTRRWNNHRIALRKNKHHNPHLQRAWNKYGEDGFAFEIVEADLETPYLISREQYWFNHTDCKKLYNVDLTAGSRLGHRHTDEAKEKLRQANLGKRASKETRQKMSEHQRGHTNPLSMRQKLSAYNRTRIFAPETRKRMSESAKKKPPVTIETRQRMREAHLGRPRAPETIQKMREKCGHLHTVTTRQKMAEIKQNKSHLTWDAIQTMRTLFQRNLGERGFTTFLGQIFGISRRYANSIVQNKTWIDVNYTP